MALYVVFYESAPDVLERVPDLYPAHRGRLDEFHTRGDLILVGPFADPVAEGSMAIFRTRESAEEFATGDPFVTGGAIARWYVREWNEGFSGL